MASILRGGSFIFYGSSWFGKNGYEQMLKQPNYENIATVDLAARSMMITGANSGLGLSSAHWWASHGGVVHMVCRNKERGEKARNDIIEKTKSQNVHLHVCDVSIMSDVRTLVKNFTAAGHKLDVLVNNAGVMLSERGDTSEGIEQTLATNTLSGFLLTNLLLPVLKNGNDPRVINVSSGGMLTDPLFVGDAYFEAIAGKWDGMKAYSKTKRQQVVLTEILAERYTKDYNIGFYSMHPGWSDTEAVSTAMPSFYKFYKEKFRTVDQGADTINWLAFSKSVDRVTHGGLFFRDRKPEIKHFYLSGTKHTEKEASALWDWCKNLTKWDESELTSTPAASSPAPSTAPASTSTTSNTSSGSPAEVPKADVLQSASL